MAVHRLVRGSRFSADQVAGNLCLPAGTAAHHQVHEGAYLARRLGREHASAGRRPLLFDDGRPAEDAAVDQGGDGAGHLQWRHRDAVAEADGHGVDLAPRFGRQRRADFGQLDGRRPQQPETPEECALTLAADVDGHLGGADVGGMDDDLGHRQPPVLGVVVVDGEAGDVDRLAGVVTVAEGDGAAVERHGRGQQLEGRTHLVDALGGAVEGGGPLGAATLVGVEIGQRNHGPHFAGLDVEDDAGGTDGPEHVDGGDQLLAQKRLQADVDGKLQGAAVSAQRAVEMALDAGNSAAVDVGHAEDVGAFEPVGIDAAFGGLEVHPGDAQAVDPVDLPGSQVAAQPDEGLLRGQQLQRPRALEPGQDPRQSAHRLAGVEDLVRMRVERRRGKAGSQDLAVTIENVGAARRRGYGSPRQRSRQDPLAAMAADGQVDQAHPHQQEAEDQQGADCQQPVAPDLEGLFSAALETDARQIRQPPVDHRLDPPFPHCCALFSASARAMAVAKSVAGASVAVSPPLAAVRGNPSSVAS